MLTDETDGRHTAVVNRRRYLALGAGTLPFALGGCLQPPGGNGRTPSDGVSVRIVSRADRPDIPIEYSVEMVTGQTTDDRPARLRVGIANETDSAVALGEERAVLFHHVASTDGAVYLHPAGDEPWEGPVEPGCWRLTDHVAVPEYYGIISLQAGETVTAESYVYGHPDLSEGTCLPRGDHQVTTSGVVGEDEEAVVDGDGRIEFEWGFSLRIEE